ncbi:hypothetical protein [Achromobacter denitrificans]|uniref:hypothetical protein n=1 Tax=Achromobacter denitrificans TaxID=32002 RepID=UPI0010553037|nr:hypothetical protein [Achromobacter denitrificans]QKH44046.1 hypothetical protein FOC82_22285 [Achromobacter denitrificans]QKH48813.1 hypothetical protein FOC80_04865 [Achromobacter denitrificans]
MAPNKTKSSATAAVSRNALTVLSAAETLLVLAWTLKYSAYGVDFPDERFSDLGVESFHLRFLDDAIRLYLPSPVCVAWRRHRHSPASNILITLVLARSLAYILFKSFSPRPGEIALPSL